MSSLGPMTTGVRGENPWLAREIGDPKPLSEHLGAKVDDEVKKFIDTCFDRAKKIIRENKEKLDLVAGELMKRETLEGDEFSLLVERGEKLHQVKEHMTSEVENPAVPKEEETV